MEEPLAPLTPKFNKPTRMPSTASVDTKRWVYQHPGVPKPKACEPRALLQEPLPVQKDDEVATDAQVQEAEPMEEDAELMEEDAEQMEKGAEQVEEEAEQMEEEAEEEPVRTKGAPSKACVTSYAMHVLWFAASYLERLQISTSPKSCYIDFNMLQLL